MKPLNCAATRRRLSEFHDGELPVSDQISVGSHLEWCDECAALSDDFRLMRKGLQQVAPGRASLARHDAEAFTTSVVSRLKAEDEASFFASVCVMFEDLHLLYAGLGATASTVACVVVILGMMSFTADERPDAERAASLAAVVDVLATPGTSAGSIAIDDEMRTRWTALFRQANETAQQDAVFELSAAVTRDGHRAMLPHSHQLRRASVEDGKIIEGLLDSVSRARLDIDLEDLPPSAMLWVVTRTTVRATKMPPLDLQLPAPKKSAGLPLVGPAPLERV
jgi:hypothetical protein